MAERIKDAEDRLLESMFDSAPIADDGFSARVVQRVRRRIWVRRLTLPVATVVGLLVSFKPMVALVTTLAGLSKLIPQDVMNITSTTLPQLPMIVLGAMLLVTCMLGLRTLED